MAKYQSTVSAVGQDFLLKKGGEYEAKDFTKEVFDDLVRCGHLIPKDKKETTANPAAANRETRGGQNND